MARDNDPNKPMDTREYRQYSEKHHGKGALNDSMLRSIDRATDGKKVSRSQLDQLHGKIKIRQQGEK